MLISECYKKSLCSKNRRKWCDFIRTYNELRCSAVFCSNLEGIYLECRDYPLFNLFCSVLFPCSNLFYICSIMRLTFIHSTDSIVFSNVISKKAFNCVSPVALTGISQLFGGIILLILCVALGGHMEFNIAESYILLYMCAVSVASYCI